MPFAKLSGLEIPCSIDQGQRGREEIGSRRRAPNGKLHLTRVAVKNSWPLKLAIQQAADAEDYARWILGEGHTFPFDTNVYSSKGIGPASVANISIQGAAKFGAGAALVTGSVSMGLLADAGNTKATALIWKRRVDNSAWDHYAFRTDGSKWKNGSTTADSTPWLTLSGTGVTLDKDGADNSQVDDLVFFPYELPAAWIVTLTTAAAAAFSLLPFLTLEGDLVAPASSRSVAGEIGSEEIVPAVLGGALRSNAKRFDFTLHED